MIPSSIPSSSSSSSRFKHEKGDELKKILLEFTRLQVEYHRNVGKAWEDLTPKLEAMDVRGGSSSSGGGGSGTGSNSGSRGSTPKKNKRLSGRKSRSGEVDSTLVGV